MSLFDRVMEESGLSRVFARRALERALNRCSARPETLTATQLRDSLAHIEAALKVFLPPEEVSRRMTAITRLTSS